MEILSDNISWMLFNLFLAVLPVLFAWLFLSKIKKIFKIILALFWSLYLPNTIYILTDFIHLIEQWNKILPSEKILLVVQYVIFELLGLLFFILAFYPFEKVLKKYLKKRKRLTVYTLVVCNFIVGFGMVLGRIERVNSWEVFTNTRKVLQAVLQIVHSSQQVFLVILFGVFVNLFYFSFRNSLAGIAKKIFLVFNNS